MLLQSTWDPHMGKIMQSTWDPHMEKITLVKTTTSPISTQVHLLRPTITIRSLSSAKRHAQQTHSAALGHMYHLTLLMVALSVVVSKTACRQSLLSRLTGLVLLREPLIKRAYHLNVTYVNFLNVNFMPSPLSLTPFFPTRSPPTPLSSPRMVLPTQRNLGKFR